MADIVSIIDTAVIENVTVPFATLESLLGKLQHCSAAVPIIRQFLKPIYEALVPVYRAVSG